MKVDVVTATCPFCKTVCLWTTAGKAINVCAHSVSRDITVGVEETKNGQVVEVRRVVHTTFHNSELAPLRYGEVEIKDDSWSKK